MNISIKLMELSNFFVAKSKIIIYNYYRIHQKEMIGDESNISKG